MKFFGISLLLIILLGSIAYADAVVVLGSGLLEKKSTGRIISALNSCTNATKYIIFTGRGIYNESEASFLESIYLKYNKECLAIPLKEEHSFTTISNAYNTVKLLQKLNVTQVTIATSIDHFYAPFIFRAVSFIEDYPLEMKFVYSNFTKNY